MSKTRELKPVDRQHLADAIRRCARRVDSWFVTGQAEQLQNFMALSLRELANEIYPEQESES